VPGKGSLKGLNSSTVGIIIHVDILLIQPSYTPYCARKVYDNATYCYSMMLLVEHNRS
jgi:hypothetical protein